MAPEADILATSPPNNYSQHAEDQPGTSEWHELAEPVVAEWDARIRALLGRKDLKFRLTFARVETYRVGVLRWIDQQQRSSDDASPCSGGSERAETVAKALARVQATQETLLAILELQREAILSDCVQQLYRVLMELSMENIHHCSVWFGAHLFSRQLTSRIMALVNSTVAAKTSWVEEQFAQRVANVQRFMTQATEQLQGLLPELCS